MWRARARLTHSSKSFLTHTVPRCVTPALRNGVILQPSQFKFLLQFKFLVLLFCIQVFVAVQVFGAPVLQKVQTPTSERPIPGGIADSKYLFSVLNYLVAVINFKP